MEITLKAIGKIRAEESHVIEIDSEYAPGLSGLSGFSHVIIVWFANKATDLGNYDLVVDKPYRLAPEKLGVFATRSEYRPNNICISMAPVLSVDEKNGLVNLLWTDAEDGTPVIDLKPYQPCADSVRDVQLPDWCSYWPSCYEDSAEFTWDEEFLF